MNTIETVKFRQRQLNSLKDGIDKLIAGYSEDKLYVSTDKRTGKTRYYLHLLKILLTELIGWISL